MKIETDVLILGAGPAGCMAALTLSKRYKVTIVELNRLPRKKSCSGVLIKKTVDLVEENWGTIPNEVKCFPENTTGLNIVTYRGEELNYQDKGVNILRDKFDYWLLGRVLENNVEIFEDSALKAVTYEDKMHYCVVRRGRKKIGIVAKAIIACDGVNGNSRKLLGAPRQKKVVTVQQFYEGTNSFDPSKFYAFTSGEFSQYDAWTNSKDGNIIIGSIGFTKKSALNYLRIFIRYLEKEGKVNLKKQLCQEVWSLPLVLPNLDVLYQYNNVFFAGEVAGLLNPFGEGISIALSSGKAIAQALIEGNYFVERDVERVTFIYEEKLREEVCYMKRQWKFLKEISPEFYENLLAIDAT